MMRLAVILDRGDTGRRSGRTVLQKDCNREDCDRSRRSYGSRRIASCTKNGESDRFPSARYGLFRRKIMVGKNAWAPPCGARTRAGGSCLARVVIGPEGPRSRCRMHGGHLLSGKQTPAGRKRISDAVRKRMLAFWDAWREQGKPTLPWADRLRTAKPMRPATSPPALSTDEQRKARVKAELKRRWPDRNWDDLQSPD
jgi:hypothetical protein